jgi:hypothetical protein
MQQLRSAISCVYGAFCPYCREFVEGESRKSIVDKSFVNCHDRSQCTRIEHVCDSSNEIVSVVSRFLCIGRAITAHKANRVRTFARCVRGTLKRVSKASKQALDRSIGPIGPMFAFRAPNRDAQGGGAVPSGPSGRAGRRGGMGPCRPGRRGACGGPAGMQKAAGAPAGLRAAVVALGQGSRSGRPCRGGRALRISSHRRSNPGCRAFIASDRPG